MPTPFAVGIAAKAIDIFDDYMEMPTGPQLDELTARVQVFVDDTVLAFADQQLDPANTFAQKMLDLTTAINAAVAEAMAKQS